MLIGGFDDVAVSRAASEGETRDQGDVSDKTPLPVGAHANLGRLGRSTKRFCQAVFNALERRCPDRTDHHRWRRAITDGACFLAQWGEQAAALGWTARDLFGLAAIPKRPGPNYQRLSRYDQMGLIWLLQGRRVAALTKDTAVIQTANSTLSYYKPVRPNRLR